MSYEAATGMSGAASGERSRGPVDLVHLAHQTLGDVELEREVLAMFERNARIYLLRLRMALRPGERRSAAHLISGSARGVGAWRVADLARSLEEPSAQTSEALDALEAAIEEAVAFIRTVAP
jgi:HPt (histidine-containing phosphotransfer) domain-containing protein